MSWMGSPWDQEWGGGSNGEEGTTKTIQMFTDSLRLVKKPEPIKLSTEWHALREEDEEEEEDWEKEEKHKRLTASGNFDQVDCSGGDVSDDGEDEQPLSQTLP